MNVSFTGGMSSIYNSDYNAGNPKVVLADGQKISVTVLKNNGDGTCLVSFGGGKFNVKCQKEFHAGQTFEATVSEAGGKIQLQPAEEKIFAASFVRFMEGNGLVPDAVTAKVFEFMEQSGVKIDKGILQKSRAVALNFPGHEKAAAEIACMLMEEGLEPKEETVRRLLLYLDYTENNPDKPAKEKEEQKEQCAGKKESTCNEPLFLDGVYSVLPCRKPGILSFMNQYKTKGTCKHWLVLPYEWQLENKSARGFIKLLLDTELNFTEKIQINCEFPCKKYFFVLYLNHSKVKEVRFCSLPPLLTSDIHTEERRLGELFCSGMNGNSVPVTYSSLAYSEGLYSSSEVPFSFEDIA